MPLTIDASVQAALDTGLVVRRDMLNIDFVSGAVGFHSGQGEFTYNTITYYGVGSLIEVQEIRQSQNIEENAVKVVMRSDSEISPDVLGTIESEVYHRRAANLLTKFIDVSDQTTIGYFPVFAGVIDQIVHQEGESEYALHITLVDRFRDLRQANHRVRTFYDQTLISATDTFLQHVATVGEELIEWGSGAETTGNRSKGGFFTKWRARRVAAGKKIIFPNLGN